MERIEQELRAGLARVVESPPALPGLGEQIIRRGRRKHRQRVAFAGAAVAAVLFAVGFLLVPPRHPVPEPAQPLPSGPARVAMTFEDTDGNEIMWPGRHVTNLGDGVAIATIPEGAVVATGGRLEVLPENGTPRLVVQGLQTSSVAVSPDGLRAVVVRNVNGRRQLQEIELETGTVKRSVPLTEPLVAAADPVDPVFYSSDSVLLNLGNQDAERVAVWEPGPDQVVGKLDTYTSAIAGGPLGSIALADPTSGCTAVGILGASLNEAWRSCGQDFIGFAPDGAHALVLSQDGRTVLVRHTPDGKPQAFTLAGQARSIGWESDDTFLYTAPGPSQDSNVVVRCGLTAGACRTIDTVVNRVPTPIPAYGN